MPRSICLIQGHPHGAEKHFCHALADSYEHGARLGGMQVSHIDLGSMDLSLLRDPADFLAAPPPPVADAQDKIRNADHLVVVFPLWLGTMPAVVKAFFEHVCRNNFAVEQDAEGGLPKQKLKGKSARVIVTMGMPAFAYRTGFGAHGVRSLEKSILGMAGVGPVRETLIGGVGALNKSSAAALLLKIQELGRRAR